MAAKTKQIQNISKSSIKIYLGEKLDFLTTQKNIHISKREGNQNLVYLNAQRDFIVKMKESLQIE